MSRREALMLAFGILCYLGGIGLFLSLDVDQSHDVPVLDE